ncbi:MAG: 50S ribosomal protein L10 [Parcubacteria group bacterium]|nr:50S ribosomal protein L10 [Parcubacteria group bacterium]
MAVTKIKKAEIYKEITGIAKGEGSRVFVNFHGLSVADSTALRRSLRGEGIGYFVAKKTIAKKAFGESGVSGEMPEMPGEFAVAYGEDLIAPAREVYKFQKLFKDKISITGGVFEGRFVEKDEMIVIASIPSRQVLYAQFVNLINSPIQRLAVAFDQIAQAKEQSV